MPTLLDDLAARWPVKARREDALTVALSLGGRHQKIVVQAGLDAVTITAEVCYREGLDPLAALRYNAAAEQGELALVHGVHALRRRVRIEAASPETLDGAIRAVAVEATLVRQRLVRAPDARSLRAAFAGYLT